MSEPPPPSREDAAPAGRAEQEHDALAPGTRLDEFETLRVLGAGGFGVVYLALDHALERQVAIKEYMPAMLASRGSGAELRVRSPRHAETYAKGLASFINEAKLLARFDHPSLLKVYRFWEANGTAYMVMPYYPGRTLAEVRLAMPQRPDEDWLMGIIEPLLGALEVLHAEGVCHRDIAPDNVVLLPDGRPVLLDFGAARRAIGDGQPMTAVLKPSFAPIEQYAEVPHLRQGPWTDLYALGAVLYFLLTGKAPTSAAARAVHDELDLPAAVLATPGGGVSQRLLATVAWALAVRPQDRPQNVQALREALGGTAAIPEPPPRVEPDPPAAPPRLLVEAPWPQTIPYVGRVRPGHTYAPEHAAQALADGAVDVPVAVDEQAAAAAEASAPVESVPPPEAPASEPGAAPTADPPVAPRASKVAGARRRLGAAAVVLGVAALVLGAFSFNSQRRHVALELDAGALRPLAAASAPAAPPDDPASAPLPADLAPSGVLALTAADTAMAASAAPQPPASAPATTARPDRPARANGRDAPVRKAAARAPSKVSANGGRAAGVAAGPRQLCGDRVFASLAACMRRECVKPRYSRHPQCVQMREEEERRLLQLVGG